MVDEGMQMLVGMKVHGLDILLHRKVRSLHSLQGNSASTYRDSPRRSPSSRACDRLAQMPAVESFPTGRWMSDCSTPMIEWIDRAAAGAEGGAGGSAAALFSRFLEDYADECMWRPASLSLELSSPMRG